jgi:hypothetical protein
MFFCGKRIPHKDHPEIITISVDGHNHYSHEKCLKLRNRPELVVVGVGSSGRDRAQGGI